MKCYRISIFLTILLMVISVNLCQAQDPGDPSANDPAVPIDGGITLLLAAGAAYAARNLYRKAHKERGD
jgi:hypothetical protein